MKKITLLMFLFAAFTMSAQNDTVTFKVDLAGYSGTGFTSAHVNGTFNNWCGACNPMSDPDGDGVWEVALPLTAGTIEYKFTIDGWNDQENLTSGLPCTITTGGFTNRELTFSGDTVLSVVCWESCAACGGGAASGPLSLPITFDDPNIAYPTSSFGGAADTLVVDPTDPTNMVLEITKDAAAQTWAGSIVGDSGLAAPVAFAAGATTMTMRVWSPDAGVEIRLKLEDFTDPTVSVETVDSTTVAGGWETLTFDFSNQASGTAAINFASTYDKIAVFPNFGASGTTKTFYIDDIMFGAGGPSVVLPSLPITFDDPNVDYTSGEFGGATDTIVADPTDPTNMVSEIHKDGTAQTWAGIVITNSGLASPVPFTANDNILSMRVWSPDAGIEVRMKIEDNNDPTVSVETVDTIMTAGAWDTLVFDFSNQASGTAAINYANTYDKVVVFPNFGVDGATAGAKTYYVDDISFGMIMPPPPALDTIDLPITFDDPSVDYDVTSEFGGCVDSLTVDPTNASNNVLRIEKTGGAETWGGIVVTTGGMKNTIPFTATSTGMKMRVWSPDAGTDFLLKVEDSNDATISAETVATTTTAGAWETLSFDLSNTPAGTPAFDPAANYDVVVVFPNFGTPGIAVGAKTYYIDDIEFDNSIGLNEANWAANWTLAPNPSTGIVRLEGLQAENFDVQVMDLNGRLILKTNTSQLNQGELNLSNLNNGIYLITVSNEFKSESRKLIITK